MDVRPIFLIGLPGCGKSTFGRSLARALGREFIDLDRFIENRRRKSVAEIFAAEGESAFRVIESRMLQEVAEFENVVVACGGGTPVTPGNMELMSERGRVVWLKASDEVLLRRLWAARHKRPHIAALEARADVAEYIERLHAARDSYYAKAHIEFGSDLLESRDMIDASVERFLQML